VGERSGAAGHHRPPPGRERFQERGRAFDREDGGSVLDLFSLQPLCLGRGVKVWGDERDRLGGPPAVRDREDVGYVEAVEIRPLASGPPDGGRGIHQHPVEIEQHRVAPEPIHFRYSSPALFRARFAIVQTRSTNGAQFGGVQLAALSQSAEQL
jgi:hypothetical protein